MTAKQLVFCGALGCVAAVANAQTTSAPVPSTVQLPSLDAETEITISMTYGTYTVPGHYYRSISGKGREDSEVGSIIIDSVAQTVTMLNSATSQAIVVSQPGTTPPRQTSAAALSFAATGSASVEGHPVQVMQATDSTGRSQVVWTATDIGLPVRVQRTGQGLTFTKVMKNIVLKEPDPSVFQIPAGFTVVPKTGFTGSPGASTGATPVTGAARPRQLPVGKPAPPTGAVHP